MHGRTGRAGTGVFALGFTLMAAAGMLSGCGAGTLATSIGGSALHGSIHGGQQPVVGASIFLYAAGSSGNGLGAVNLLAPVSVSSDANGAFNITGDYVCPAATTPVYLVAQGGNPGLAPGTNNAALLLVAALGDCGNLSASTFVSMNEVTTVAAAWALSQFASADGTVGASGTNLTGIRNAFAVASLLVNPATGLAPGAGLGVGASSEPQKLYSLANALAACVNSDGGLPCAALFAAAGGSQSNTWAAALNIVRNPGANVDAVLALSSAAPPFQPGLAKAPHDWTMSVTYGACKTGCGGLNGPEGLAIDSGGNVWVANYFGAAVSKFSAAGIPAAPQGFAGAGLNQSYGITIDASDSAWVTNEQSVSAAGNSRHGSVSKFNAQGAEVSGAGYTGGGIYYPVAIAADAMGNMWVADYGSSSASLLANGGTAISPSGGLAVSALPFTAAVAIDSAQNAWFATEDGVSRVTPAGAVSSFPCCDDLTGLAIDQTGNLWAADYGAFSIVELNATGSVVQDVSTADGLLRPQAIAVDGKGDVWVANYYGNSVTALTGSTAAIRSPLNGFGLDAPLMEPYSLAIDASGNLWLSNSGSNTLSEMIGLASPVRTPMLGPPAQP